MLLSIVAVGVNKFGKGAVIKTFTSMVPGSETIVFLSHHFSVHVHR